MKNESITGSHVRLRKSFGRTQVSIDIPNLITLQNTSYANFLQADVAPEKRKDIGLQAIFNSVFPISDYNQTVSLEFVKYHLSHPKYDIQECRQRDMTYAAPLQVTLRLVVFDAEEEGEKKTIQNVKEQDVYLSEIPLMTENASFIINGTERVVVSQLHRSPGVFFDHDGGKGSAGGKLMYSGRVIPYRGSWLDFELDQKDLMNVRIDRKRKFPATILLKALGFSIDDILKEFHDFDTLSVKGGKIYRNILDIEAKEGQRFPYDIKDASGKVFLQAGRRVTRMVVKKHQKSSASLRCELTQDHLKQMVLGKPIIDKGTGEILADVNQDFTPAVLDLALSKGVKDFSVIVFDGIVTGPYISQTLLVDKVSTKEESLLEIYKRMKPGEPVTLEAAEAYLNYLFFDPATYDLGKVGRVKINHRFGWTDIPETEGCLTKKILFV